MTDIHSSTTSIVADITDMNFCNSPIELLAKYFTKTKPDLLSIFVGFLEKYLIHTIMSVNVFVHLCQHSFPVNCFVIRPI
jgi:hypothetical protein